MSGAAQILDENTRLRALSQGQMAQLEAQAVLLQEQGAQLEVFREQLERLAAVNDELRLQVRKLTEANDHFTKHAQFLELKREVAAAERFIAEQQQLVLVSPEPTPPPRDPKVRDDDAQRRATGKGTHPRRGRRNLADLKLPKVRREVPADELEGANASDYVLRGSETSYRLEWEPGRFVVVEVVRQRIEHRDKPGEVWTAPIPYLLPDALCGNGLLASVIVDKFADHVPLNRQARRFATRHGIPLGTNVISDWVLEGAKKVECIVSAIRGMVVASLVLRTDDTGMSVQDGKNGKVRKGRLWVYTDTAQAFYDFSRTKEGTNPADLLQRLNFRGRLIADGGSEYNLVIERLGLERGGCWAHLRRYFRDASLQHNEALPALVAIRDLFMIERDLTELSDAERLAARELRSKPIVDAFFEWARRTSTKARPNSKLGRAVGYALLQESRMRLFLAHGAVPLHNNLSELLLRQPVVGRKNYLFARSQEGAKAAAIWYSLIGSCMLQAIDPFAYLYDLFERLPSHPGNRIHELTPLNWRLAVEAGTLHPRTPPGGIPSHPP